MHVVCYMIAALVNAASDMSMVSTESRLLMKTTRQRFRAGASCMKRIAVSTVYVPAESARIHA